MEKKKLDPKNKKKIKLDKSTEGPDLSNSQLPEAMR